MNRYFIGIDPGATGAIAALDHHGEFADLIDMPLFNCDGVKIVDDACWWRFVPVGAYVSVAVEKVHSMPGQGVKSMFTFGGMFHGSIILARRMAGRNQPTLVTPQDWKKHHGLIGTEKDASRLLAIEKWPSAAHLLPPNKKGIGRADALLIADWLRVQEL